MAGVKVVLILIRIFVFAIFFNMILPSGDVYSDILLMFRTWNFQNTDSLEMSGCRACFGKSEQDLIPNTDNCQNCITKNGFFDCGQYFTSMNKFIDIERESTCDEKKWGFHYQNFTLAEGECDRRHRCCFERKLKNLNVKNKIETKTIQFHRDLLIDCDNDDLNEMSNNFGKPCLLVGKARGDDCTWKIVVFNKNRIAYFLTNNKNTFQ